MEGCLKGGVVIMDIEIVTHINTIPIYRRFTDTIPYTPSLKNRSKALRKVGILSEVIFWIQAHKGKFYKIDFDRQRIIGNYIVDFYIKQLSLIIEIDGASHNEKDEYDEKREQYFKDLGLNIYKISDTRVKHDLGNVMNKLEMYISKEYSKPFN